MTSLTIRLTPELEELLVAKSKAAGQSKSEFARTVLVEALEGSKTSRAKRALGGEEKCRHPVNRRIGDFCGICGEKAR